MLQLKIFQSLIIHPLFLNLTNYPPMFINVQCPSMGFDNSKRNEMKRRKLEIFINPEIYIISITISISIQKKKTPNGQSIIIVEENCSAVENPSTLDHYLLDIGQSYHYTSTRSQT